MADPRLEKLATLLVGYSVAVQPEERIWISGDVVALPLIREVYRAILRAGGHPFTLLSDERLTEIFYTEAEEAQLDFVHPPQRYVVENYEARIHIGGATNTRFLSGVDSAKQQRYRLAVSDLTETTMRRTADESYRWLVTQFPTNAAAQDADMALSQYEAFVYGAYHLEEEDPVAVWRGFSERQARLVDWLAGRDRVEVQGENIDLRLSIAGRSFINDDGHFNMPGGEIFTGPVEESVEGSVRFTYPAIYGGREVEGVELRFEGGRVVEASATKNESFLLDVLDTDEGARVLGEWAIGTNFGIDRFTRNILFDEKIGGTLHMAVGAGYPQTGSRNRSAVHWDMICDLRSGARILVDGELFYEDGRFVIEEA